MRTVIGAVLVLSLAACTSAEEKAQQRELAMIEAAKADSVSEAEFVEDSVKLAASITVDTVRTLRIVDQRSADDDGTFDTIHQAVSPTGLLCAVTVEKYRVLVVGDTLSCQWAPNP